MKTVRITLRSTTSRVPFRSGTYRAMLEDESAQGYAVLGTTRAYTTWGKAAGAALRLADRHGYFVVNRELVESRIATEMPRHVADGGPGNKSE